MLPATAGSASLPLLVGMAVAAGVAALGTGLAVGCGPVDLPRDRGLHHRPTPTSGGIAILLGAACGLQAMAALDTTVFGSAPLAAAFALATLMGLLGAVDDVRDLSPRLKLALQAGLALLFAGSGCRVEALSTPLGTLALGPLIGTLGSALWIVVAANAVNFMDGANGLAPGAMVIALASLGTAACAAHLPGGIGSVALVAAAAGLGFLPWNLPLGRTFQGDVGALFSSTLFAALVLLAAGQDGEGGLSLWFGPLALLPLLTDVFLTLLARARRRVPLLSAHREHLFQRWLVARSATHAALSWRVWGMMIAAGALAAGLGGFPVGARAAVFAVALGLSVLLWRRIDRDVRSEPIRPNG
jgi:UDP-N-acetylmuramyl pentapeptide phosphotransferase/UDP-N-acetylglucosamine-1-phosphate transferase